MVYKRDLDLEIKWQKLLKSLETTVGKKPRDLNAVLFLIGVQELGRGAKAFTKEEKQDLIHIATCKILSYAGFYELDFIDEDGWPHWSAKSKLPKLDLTEQEKLLKMQTLEYFETELNFESI